jgi:DNA integrity scanning protein DisA with diadenylate cyclase activity
LRAVFLWLKGGDNMYKEKLLSQIKILENLQEKIGIYDVSETIQLSGEILRLANKLDELEVEYTTTANLDKSFEELSEDKQEKVRRFIEERFIKRN